MSSLKILATLAIILTMTSTIKSATCNANTGGTSVTNCKTGECSSDSSAPNTCGECDTDFYPTKAEYDAQKDDATKAYTACAAKVDADTGNCATIVSQTSCSACDDGYGLDGDNKCAECDVSNCEKCSDDKTKCGTCKDGYTTNDAKDECVEDDDDDDTDGAFRLSVISWMTLGLAMVAGINF